MMLTGLLFLLSLTGGSALNHSATTDSPHDLPSSSSSPGQNGSASNSSATTDSPHDLPRSSSSPEQSGSASKKSARPDRFGDLLRSNFSFVQNRSALNYSATTGRQQKPKHTTNCTDREVYESLKLKHSNMIRPGRHGSPTKVRLGVLFPAILDVNDQDQKFVSSIWITLRWFDKSLSWKDCNNFYICIPTKEVWTPDLTIDELIKMENTRQNPYVRVNWDGEVNQRLSMVVTTTCKMEVYKFPFDVQRCNLSFKSIQYFAKELSIEMRSSHNWTKKWRKDCAQTRSEWLFDDLKTYNQSSDKFGFGRSVVVYAITMKRRPILYIANILLPILFFFCLDLASFLISDNSSEKLSFKVTVLLAVTVMQLILNDILPSTSDRVPLIAVYCIGMFGLMMISLFETILVMYLMEKDIEADDYRRPKTEDCVDKRSKVSFCSCCKELKRWTPCARTCGVSVDEPPSELLSATKECDSSELTEESVALEKLSGEMKKVIHLLNSREELGSLGSWTRMAKTINRVFVILYVSGASAFLVVLFSLWNDKSDK